MPSLQNFSARARFVLALLLPAIFAIASGHAQSATATTLTVTAGGAPATSIAANTAVTLTATVAAAGKAVSPGQVYFCNASAAHCTASNNVFTAQLSPAGTATYKFIPGLGSHSYVAVFAGTSLPANASYRSSTSAASAALTVAGKTHTFATLAPSGTSAGYTLAESVFGAGPAAPSGEVTILGTKNSTGVSSTLTTGTLKANPPAYSATGISSTNGYTPVADLNGDGIPDGIYIAQGSGLSPNDPCGNDADLPNTTYLNFAAGNGDGTFAASKSQVPIFCGDSIENTVAVDLNNDGALDLVVYAYAPLFDAHVVSALLNDGKGNFTLASTTEVRDVDVDTPTQIGVADFNRDGNMDLAVNSGTKIAILTGDGTGKFTLQSWSAAIPDGSPSFIVGDVNNDGYPDILALGSSSVSIFLGTGAGFTQSTYTNSAITYGVAMAAGDLNHDGNLDIVINNANNTDLYVLQGDGTGKFPGLTTLANAAAQTEPGYIAVADFNNDGNLDIVESAGDSYVGQLTYFQGNGSGSFGPVIDVPNQSNFDLQYSIPPTIIDIDGDGLPDIAAALMLFSSTQSATATISDYTLPIGSGLYFAYPSYAGDGNYLASYEDPTAFVEITSPTVTPTITLTGPATPPAVDATARFTATVSGAYGTPTGEVYFYSNGTFIQLVPMTNGSATLATGFDPAGTYSVTARYAGDVYYSAITSAPLSVNVTGTTASTVTLSYSPASPTYGQPVTVKAVVKGTTTTPTGTITFSEGPGDAIALDNTGTASYTYSATATPPSTLAAGSHTITAQYSGNNTYKATPSNAVTIVVGQAGTSATATTLTATSAGAPATSIATNTAVTLTAAVTSAGAPVTAGQVYFCAASTTRCSISNNLAVAQLTSSGVASYTLIPGPGSRSYVAVFAGTAAAAATNYGTSTSSPSAAFTVTGKANSSAGLTVSPDGSAFTLAATIYGSGPAAPAGKASILGNNNFTGPFATVATGTLTANPAALAFNAVGGYGMAVADFNRDGIPDSFLIGEDSGTYFQYICRDSASNSSYTAYGFFSAGNGAGTPGSLLQQVQLPCGATNAVVADVNNDGYPDLIVDGAFQGAPMLTVLLNDGTGHFTVNSLTSTPTGTPGLMTVADFNHDGNADFAVNNGTNIQIGLGDGTGNFKIVSTGAPSATGVDALVVGDINNDGFPDIITLNSKAAALAIYLGDGTGSFGGAMPYTNKAITFGTLITMADLNNDGNLDIAFNNAADTAINVLSGDGTGKFPTSATVAISSPQAQSFNLGAADLDLDGNIDIFEYGIDATAPNPRSLLSVFKGNGAGAFTLTTFPLAMNYSAGLSWVVADVNGDGRPDVLVGGLSILGSTQSATATITGFTEPPATGYYSLEPSFAGDSNYLATTNGLSVTIHSPMATPTVTVTGPASPVAINVSLPFTATVSGVGSTPTELVTFYDNGTQMGSQGLQNGVAVLDYAVPTAGTHAITAIYSGDSNYNQATSAKPFTLTATSGLAPTVTVTSSPTSLVYGTPITIKAVVAGTGGTPTGNVSFHIGSGYGPVTLDSHGTGSFTITNLSSFVPGSYSGTIAYSGDSTYSAATSAPFTVTIGKAVTTLTAGLNVTATNLSSTGYTGTFNGALALPAGSESVSATGTITFYLNNKAVASPQVLGLTASSASGDLSVGTYQLTAAYSGDTDFAPVTTTTPITVTVPRFTSTIDTSALATAGTYGAPLNLNVTIDSSGPKTPAPTGTVTFRFGSTTLGPVALNSSAQATVTVPAGGLPAGTSAVTIAYSGDSVNAPATATGQVKLAQAQPTLVLTSSAPTAVYGSPLTFTGKLTYPGAAPTGKITISDGTTVLTSATPVNGVVTFTTSTLSAGSHTLTAAFAGDSNYLAATSASTTVTVTAAQGATITPTPTNSTSYVGSSDVVTITLAGIAGKPIPTGTITLSGSGYTSAATALVNGTVSITIPANSLPVGNDTITAAYSGDSVYGASSSTFQINVTSTPPSVKLAPASAALSLNAGATTGNTDSITITPQEGLTGSVQLSAVVASGPAGAVNPPTLSFGTTSPITLDGKTAAKATLTINTTAPTTTAANEHPASHALYAAGATILACLVLIPTRRRRLRTLFAVLLSLGLYAGLTACGGSGSGSGSGGGSGPKSNPGTTPGAYQVTVTATGVIPGSSAAVPLNTTTITLTVQ